MILILKEKKGNKGNTAKTVRIIAKKLLASGIKVKTASLEEVKLLIKNNHFRVFVDGEDFTKFKTVFLRRIGTKKALATVLANFAQKNGITFFDQIHLANSNEASKLKQTALLALNGINVPKTIYTCHYTVSILKEAITFLNLPIVVKRTVGRKGSGVFLAKTAAELKEIIDKNKANEFMLQEFIPNFFDYRILVLGNNIVCVIKRIRVDKNEFRNNVSLGAKEEFIDSPKLPTRIGKIVFQAVKIANIQIAGVDIIIDQKGKAYILEVNRAPSFTYDEKISPELNLLAQFLIKCEKKNKKS